MALASGTYQLGPAAGTLFLHTGRAGLGAKAGHDLTIEVTRWSGSATVDLADPSRSTVSVDVDVDSLEVREGTGGVKPLTDSDRAEIKRIIGGKILHTASHPTIAFRSTSVEGTPESFTVAGDLTILGVTQPVALQGAVDTNRARGTAIVTQTRWGIKPYSALLGALKLRDDVEVRFDVAF
jgi:polyisoprenoid-binding protein YceI